MATKAADQITIVDLTDAYSVMLSMDAISLNGGTSTLGTQQTATVNVVAFRGSEQLTPTVGTITSSSNNVTTSVGSASNQVVPITVTFKAALNTSGKLTIPVTVEGVTINKEFTWSIAFKGSGGSSSYTHIRYSASSDGSNMVSTPTDATIYIGVYTGTASTAPTTPSSYTWSRYTGNDGQDGQDAITMVITSSGGTIFKNTAIATTLTAHVYKAGVELNSTQIAALGTVKWYKDGGSTAVSTGTTKSISAGDVTNKAVFEARLEA